MTRAEVIERIARSCAGRAWDEANKLDHRINETRMQYADGHWQEYVEGVTFLVDNVKVD